MARERDGPWRCGADGDAPGRAADGTGEVGALPLLAGNVPLARFELDRLLGFGWENIMIVMLVRLLFCMVWWWQWWWKTDTTRHRYTN